MSDNVSYWSEISERSGEILDSKCCRIRMIVSFKQSILTFILQASALYILLQISQNRFYMAIFLYIFHILLVAKNYLSEDEISKLNLLVDQYLSFAEFQAKTQNQMTMRNWIIKLDDFLKLNEREILDHLGKIRQHPFSVFLITFDLLVP